MVSFCHSFFLGAAAQCQGNELTSFNWRVARLIECRLKVATLAIWTTFIFSSSVTHIYSSNIELNARRSFDYLIVYSIEMLESRLKQTIECRVLYQLFEKHPAAVDQSTPTESRRRNMAEDCDRDNLQICRCSGIWVYRLLRTDVTMREIGNIFFFFFLSRPPRSSCGAHPLCWFLSSW